MRRAGAWRCERIWILNTSNSDVTRAVGIAIQEGLLERPDLTEVAYFGRDELPLDVRRPPDLYVLLELEDSHAFAIPGFGSFGADVHITVGRRPALATSSLYGSDVSTSIQSSFECSANSYGFLSRGARNRTLAEAVSGSLDLGAQLDSADESLTRASSPDLDWIEDRATPPDDLPAFGAEATAQHLYSQGAWLRHEETLWQIEVTGDPSVWMTRYLEDLENAGWDAKDPRHPSDVFSPRATATLGHRYLTISSNTAPDMRIVSTTTTDVHGNQMTTPVPPPIEAYATGTTTLLVSHETRFNGHEIRRLFELNQDAWPDMIPHLSDRERGLLRDELAGDSDPALQDLAARLAAE